VPYEVAFLGELLRTLRTVSSELQLFNGPHHEEACAQELLSA
jgi:hypothetical protein